MELFIRNGLKQGDALSRLLFNFALEYAVGRVQVNQDGLKLNGTHQLLAYADDVNILGGSVHTVKKSAVALVAATKEIGLEVNADKTKYTTVSQDQNAGQIHSMKFHWKGGRFQIFANNFNPYPTAFPYGNATFLTTPKHRLRCGHLNFLRPFKYSQNRTRRDLES